MISTLSSGFIAASILLASSIVSADLASITTGLLTPTFTAPVGQVSVAKPPGGEGEETDLGCYEGFAGMTFAFSFNYMSPDQCKFECINKKMTVLGVSAGFDCYCGLTTPPASAKVDDSKCNMGCAGFGQTSCGGPNSSDGTIYMRVMNDMLNGGGPILPFGGSASTSTKPTSSSPTTPVAPSVVTESGRVITEYATPPPSAAPESSSSSSSKPSVAGIAAGVVVGIVAIAAICGGLFLFIRQKKRREVEEEHKRQVAASSFLSGRTVSSSGSTTDTRLDPAILRDRRMSDGSIMDNQDYSRRILKVTNA